MARHSRFLVRLPLLALLVAGVATAAWASNPNDVPPVGDDSIQVDPSYELAMRAYTSPMLIPASAFSSDGIDPDGHTYWFVVGAIQNDTGNIGCLRAPLYVPRFSTITAFYVNIVDNSTNDTSLNLQRVSQSTGIPENMATISTTGQDSNIDLYLDSTITNPNVDYQYSYYVTWCPGSTSGFALYNARVYYTE